MSDLIYRQDAIIAVRSHRIDLNDPKKIVRKSYEDVIRELPSAGSEIIICEDCKHWERESCVSGYCHEIGVSGLDEDFYCGYAERKEE